MIAPWVVARFLERPNRYLVRAKTLTGSVGAFLPNPGRLDELLTRGALLRLVPARSPGRRTRYDVLAVRARREWVCLDTRKANEAVEAALQAYRLPQVPRYRSVRREVPFRDSRFDFLLEGPRRTWFEVKTCSLVTAGDALFPDAPTIRGTRHLRHLTELVRKGDGAAILFLVVRQARLVRPNDEADRDFGDALRRADRAGVRVLGRRASLHRRTLVVRGPRPVVL